MKIRFKIVFNLLLVLVLTFSSATVLASEYSKEEKIKLSYEKLDKLVLNLRKAHNNDWEKIDQVLSNNGYKIAATKSKKYNVQDDGTFQLLAGEINDADFSVEMRVYLDMNNDFYHVRAYWDWKTTDFL